MYFALLRLSTPSLGITSHRAVGSLRRWASKDFQLPLSGSPFAFFQLFFVFLFYNFQLPLSGSHSARLRESGRREEFDDLSTPSLGITEPDSGIFRLSAAFCRGTPSHK